MPARARVHLSEFRENTLSLAILKIETKEILDSSVTAILISCEKK